MNRRAFLKSTLSYALVASSLSSSLWALSSCKKKKYNNGVVNIFIWDNYIDNYVVREFEKQTGIRAQFSYYGTSAGAFNRFRNGNPGFDLVVPTCRWIQRFMTANFLEKIDYDLLPHAQPDIFKKIQTQYEGAVEPLMTYGVPYMYGMQAIGYTKTRMTATNSNPPDSWKWLYDSDAYAHHMTLFRGATDVMEFGLLYLGYDVSDSNEDHNQAVVNMLIKQKKNILAFTQDNEARFLETGSSYIGMFSSGWLAQLHKRNPVYDFIVPKEGAISWLDFFCIPKNAPNKRNAHLFIDFIMQPSMNARIAKKLQYATCNDKAFSFLPDDMRNNPILFPDAETVKRLHLAEYFGEKTIELRDRLFTKVLSA